MALPPYMIYLEWQAQAVIQRLRPAERGKIFAWLRGLRHSPDEAGDYHTKDATGRAIQIKAFPKLWIFYWVDGPVREIKIVEARPRQAWTPPPSQA